MTTKICSKCKIEKEIFNFAKNNTSKNGLSCYCIDCKKIIDNETQKKYRLKNSHKLKAKSHYYNQKIETKKRKRQWYLKNKNVLYEKHKLWKQKNREKYLEIQKRYRERHQEEVRSRSRKCNKKRYWENPEKFRNIGRLYRRNNKIEYTQKLREYRKNLGKGYIHQMIRRGTNITAKEIPSELLAAWRLNLTLKRLSRRVINGQHKNDK